MDVRGPTAIKESAEFEVRSATTLSIIQPHGKETYRFTIIFPIGAEITIKDVSRHQILEPYNQYKDS